jgi:hypothetical protein
MRLNYLAIGIAAPASLIHLYRAEYGWSLFNVVMVTINVLLIIYRREDK